MYKQYLFLTISILVLGFAKCAPPSGLTKCKSDDSKCVKESAKMYKNLFVAGLPEYGVEKLDPMKIKSINASEGSLLFTLHDVTVEGLKNCEIKKVMRDNDQSKITLKILCTATLKGNYVLKGSVLLLHIEGKGKIHVDLKSALFNLVIDIVDKIGADGKKHWSVKSYHHTFDLQEKSNVVFENLFEDNAVLRQAANTVIEENGNEVIKEIGSPAITYVIGKIVKNVNHFFKAVPVEDLITDY